MTRSWLEKELEDAIAHNPTILFGGSGESIRLLGRQVRCRTGIIDLLFSQGATLLIVETKAVKATEKTIGQVARYREAIKEATDEALNTYATQRQKENLLWPGKIEKPEPICLVVAPAFDQDAINALATMGHAIVAEKVEDGLFNLFYHDRNYRFDRDSDATLIPLLKDYAVAYTTREEDRIQRHEDWKVEGDWIQRLFDSPVAGFESGNEGGV